MIFLFKENLHLNLQKGVDKVMTMRYNAHVR